MASVRILCVDDDRPTVTIISAVLKKEGYEVDTAFDGEEGLRKARESKPNLIVLDVMMPGMDGFQVCKKLRANPETDSIAVLMLTAKGGLEDSSGFTDSVHDRISGFDSGAMEFMTKPVKAKDLAQRVKAVLWASGITV